MQDNMRPEVQEFLDLFPRYGLSPDKPEDIWKLAYTLYRDFARPKSRGPTPRKRGRAASKALDDALLFVALQFARQEGDQRGDADIIRDVAKAVGWPTGSTPIETKRRRYQYLKDKSSPSAQRAIEAMRPHVPSLKRWARELEAAERAGLDI